MATSIEHRALVEQLRSLTNKLVKTDPIVAAKPAKEIKQAIAEIVSIAPKAAKHEPLLRSMLRHRLAAGQQIDDFSLNQMLAMEDSIRDPLREY
jgi:ribosomal protein L17